jgi:glucokinase
MILAGDIGGTKTTIALFERTADGLREIKSQEFASRDFTSLEEILNRFLDKTDGAIDSGCFGVAGPVINGGCKTTNLPWMLDEETLSRATRAPRVTLLNDLVAAAYGMLFLNPEEFDAINESGTEKRRENMAVISAGTGLGEALLFWDGTRHRPSASEGGHADFAPRNAEEIAFLNFLERKYQTHVSYERVLSGSGLVDLYQFFRQSERNPEPEWLTREFEIGDRNAVITASALSARDPVCVKTVETFVSIYGAEAGNLALKLFAIGGVIVAGGIAPKILPMLKNGDFMNSFCSKGRYQNLLAKIPVKVAINTRAPLIGAAHYAQP